MIKRIEDTSPPEETLTTTCLWYKNYTVLPSELECVLTYCDNATEIPNENGANYNFIWDGNVIPLNSDVDYPCKDGMKIENATYYRWHASNMSVVHCASDGELKYPAEWPQCSEDIQCGEPPVETDGGSRQWIVGNENADDYDTTVAYRCVNGSEFDTTGDSAGESVEIEISCRWNKAWDPWPVLPPCYITDCVDPFPIPDDAFLEEITSNWTRVNTSKEYRCKGMLEDGQHTRFWESDRSISTFSLFCKHDGTFQFENTRKNLPTCLEGK